MESSIKKKKSPKFQAAFKKELENYQLWLFLLPALLVLLIYKYYPMMGVQIAFRNYKGVEGIWGSQWVGLKNFVRFFKSDQCGIVIRNTLVLSFYSLLAGFPIPIIFALLINQLQSSKFKKFIQTITYAPHFISTVVQL